MGADGRTPMTSQVRRRPRVAGRPLELVVAGAGGFARETLDVVAAINAATRTRRVVVVGATALRPTQDELAGLSRAGVPYLGTDEEAVRDRARTHVVVAIGDPRIRRAVARTFETAGWPAATLVHPDATLGSRTTLGSGVVVCAGVAVSADVTLGDHVHLNPNATVGHDAVLGDYVSVNPGAVVSGHVTVGDGTLLGAGAVVLERLTVGASVVVGAASCVTRPVHDGSVVKGVPAR